MRRYHKEQLGKVRTKIVATVGPASSGPEILREMVDAGVDLFRLNFSHGTHEEHAQRLSVIRQIVEENGAPVAILQDLCGPKIRLKEIMGGSVKCDRDAVFILAAEPGGGGDPHYLTCSHAALPGELEVGQSVLFADGTVGMEVVAREPGRAWLKVVLPGLIRSNQGINVPGGALSVGALTEKDLADLDWSAAHHVAYVGLSFVRQAEDVVRLRRELEKRGSSARIVAKIEKREALENLDAIIAEADAIMVARGDLGVEVNVTRVPAEQKRIIAACHAARVPVITATQMLNSMESSNRPTRAEASDVFNAVLDGTDAVMLSGETAIGEYPVESVAIMSQIAGEAEALLFAEARAEIAERLWSGGAETSFAFSNHHARAPREHVAIARAGQVQPITESVVEAASLMSRRLNAALLIVATHTGRTALALSKQRNIAPTLALAHDTQTARAMSLFWGVTPLVMPQDITNRDQLREFVDVWCRAHGLLATGDRVVAIRGALPGDPGHNEIVVREVT